MLAVGGGWVGGRCGEDFRGGSSRDETFTKVGVLFDIPMGLAVADWSHG